MKKIPNFYKYFVLWLGIGYEIVKNLEIVTRP